MAKEHLKNRVDSEVLKLADAVAAKLSKDAGVDVSQGQVVERAIKELHAKLLGKPKKP